MRYILLALLLCGCQSFLSSPEIIKDSEVLVEDIIHEAESVIETDTGVKVDVELPLENKNAP